MTAHTPTTMPAPVRFSVIIPNFNNGATLARAIDSVLAQTHAAWEIIVVDDGSTDDSASVVRSYGERVRYIHQPNGGVSVARNTGAQHATGNWLAFLDADDCYLPLRLELHADWLSRDPALDFLLADQEYVDEQGRLNHLSLDHCAAGRALQKKYAAQRDMPMEAADFRALIADGFGEIRTLSVPATSFRDLGGFPVGKKIGEDLFFLIRLCARSRKAGVVNHPVAKYYIHESSVLRKDVVAAQRGFVETLEALEPESATFPAAVRQGLREKIRFVRLGLAYALLRRGSKGEAIMSVVPTFRKYPGVRTLKDILSIMRGLPKAER